MPADSHSVGLSEANYFIAQTTVDSCFIGPQDTAFHRIFRLDGVELAGQSGGAGRLGKLRGTDCGPYQQSIMVGCLAQSL
jgi:hypothetical protein